MPLQWLIQRRKYFIFLCLYSYIELFFYFLFYAISVWGFNIFFKEKIIKIIYKLHIIHDKIFISVLSENRLLNQIFLKIFNLISRY